MIVSRRHFLRAAGGSAAALLASGSLVDVLAQGTAHEFTGYGPLVPDPAGVLDLPAGFSCQIIARKG